MRANLELHLVGIGTGNPEHLTLAAIRTLEAADLILLPRKGEDKAELLDLRRDVCARLLRRRACIVEFELPQRAAEAETDGGYRTAVADWHDAIAREWRRQIDAHLPAAGSRIALLVWGDPSLYDSSLRIAARLSGTASALQVQVVPGITAVQALTAAHGIVLNEVAEPVLITTGRRLREAGWPADADTVVVMLDSGGAFQAIDADGVRIWWGAYLGMAQQTLIAGALGEVADDILQVRARLRQAHGWIMDVYLMRRRA